MFKGRGQFAVSVKPRLRSRRKRGGIESLKPSGTFHWYEHAHKAALKWPFCEQKIVRSTLPRLSQQNDNFLPGYPGKAISRH